MSNSRFQKSALAAAVVSLGFSMGALAQGSAGSSASGTTSSATGAAAANGGASGASAANRSDSNGSTMSNRSSTSPSSQGGMSSNRGDTMSSNRSDTMSNSTASRSGTSASNGRSAGGSEKMAKSDRKFLEEAYIGSMAEVRLGKLAQDKASSAEVKDFAQRMVDDHSKEITKLSKLAKDEGVQLPSQLDAKHQKTYDRLAKLSGAEFDRAYMKEMTSDHKKDVSEYQHAAKSAKDDQVQEHAKETVSTLKEHEKMAESTRDDLRKGSTVSMNTGSSQSRSGSQSPSRSQSPSPSQMPSQSQSHSPTSSSQAQNR